MKVFISWSGSSSKRVAEILEKRLPKFIPGIELWISYNIKKGSLWMPDIMKGLDQAFFGILCITRDNLDSDWIVFEAGAISMAGTFNTKTNMCPYLVDTIPNKLPSPLAQFNAAMANREDTFRLILDINKAQEYPIHTDEINANFNKYWSALDKDLKKIPKTDSGIRVGHPELGHLLLSHRDSVIYRIRQVARDAIGRVSAGNYDSALFLARISGEIQRSRELFRGFVGKNSRKDICVLIEEVFTPADLKKIFSKMEKIVLQSEVTPENKHFSLTGYIEVIADEVSSKLVRKLREMEGQ